ncbi:MAG: AraC family transcriptional regulator, partial [Fusobacterium periodonticum]|nr:AraC family transcriptional regulator [Fusobacterium periodonticum]
MLIVFTGISANIINLINENSRYEYILFDKKEDTIFENEENFIVIYEENYLEINNLLKLKKSKKQVYFIGIFKEGNIDLIKKLVNLEVLDYMFDISKDPLSNLINKIKTKNNKKAEDKEIFLKNPIYNSMITSFYIFDLIYGDLTKLEALNKLTNFSIKDLPNSVIILMIDDFWEICRKMDNRQRYSVKMEYLNLVKNAISCYDIKALSCSLVGTDKIIILVKSPYDSSLSDIALKIKNYISENTKYSVTLGLSNQYNDFKYIWKAYEESFQALDYSFFVGKNEIIEYKNIKNLSLKTNLNHEYIELKYYFFKNLILGNKNE